MEWFCCFMFLCQLLITWIAFDWLSWHNQYLDNLLFQPKRPIHPTCNLVRCSEVQQCQPYSGYLPNCHARCSRDLHRAQHPDFARPLVSLCVHFMMTKSWLLATSLPSEYGQTVCATNGQIWNKGRGDRSLNRKFALRMGNYENNNVVWSFAKQAWTRLNRVCIHLAASAVDTESPTIDGHGLHEESAVFVLTTINWADTST